MTYWISRGNYERVVAGLSPIERDRLDELVSVYPDEFPPEWEIDQDRIGVAFTQLLHLAQRAQAAASSWPACWWNWPKQAGKTSQWQQVAPGAWTAPPGTRMPEYVPTADLDRELVYQEPAPRRFFLNDVVPAAPFSLESLRSLMRLYGRLYDTVTREVRAGETAIAAISGAAGPGESAVTGQLMGIPIVLDPGLPPNVWRLVDPRTATVHFEGVINATYDDYVRVLRECIDETAERTGTPRYLL